MTPPKATKPAATAPKNAFASMMQSAKNPVKKPSVVDKESSNSTASTSTSNAAPVFSKSTFKGSGLGAGPKHTVSIEDQPWVEK